DDRVIKNIFIGKNTGFKEHLVELMRKNKGTYGTVCYERYRCIDENKNLKSDKPLADVGRPLPVTVCGNIYLNGAKGCSHEKNPHIISAFKAQIRITEENGHYYLYSNLGDALSGGPLADRVSTEGLGIAFESEQPYENRDGSDFYSDSDFMDNKRNEKVTVGPFEKFISKIKLV
ncbi:MAG: hypothetical protein ACI4RF_04105, partial [Eubacterium sp.]